MRRVRVEKKFAKSCGFEIFEVLWTGYAPVKKEFKTLTWEDCSMSITKTINNFTRILLLVLAFDIIFIANEVDYFI